MEFPTENKSSDCPSYEIASYIDGELDAASELELDAHLAGCAICSGELNQQKQFLSTLTSSLKNEKEIELPADFTKLIVTNAESTVSGLRRPRERFNAAFICAGLVLFILFAFGAGAGKEFNGFSSVVEQIAAVGSFFGHIIYAFAVGLIIVLRSVAAQFVFGPGLSILVTGTFIAFLIFFSRYMLRIRRT